MRKTKKLVIATIATLALVTIYPSVIPANDIIQVEAAVKISNKKLTLVRGKSKTLKLKGTKGKITWSSNKKSVATVTKKGKVTARKKGTATITAKVGKKKYTCKVTVTNPPVDNSVKCIPAKPATFRSYRYESFSVVDEYGFEMGEIREIPVDVKINTFSADFVSYKEFSNYGAVITDFDYFYPYTYKVTVSGSVPTKYANKKIGIILSTNDRDATLSIETLISANGSFSTTQNVKTLNETSAFYIRNINTTSFGK